MKKQQNQREEEIKTTKADVAERVLREELNEHEIQEKIKEERKEMDVTKQQKQGEEEIKNNKGEVAERVKLEELNENEIQEKIKEIKKEMAEIKKFLEEQSKNWKNQKRN